MQETELDTQEITVDDYLSGFFRTINYAMFNAQGPDNITNPYYRKDIVMLLKLLQCDEKITAQRALNTMNIILRYMPSTLEDRLYNLENLYYIILDSIEKKEIRHDDTINQILTNIEKGIERTIEYHGRFQYFIDLNDINPKLTKEEENKLMRLGFEVVRRQKKIMLTINEPKNMLLLMNKMEKILPEKSVKQIKIQIIKQILNQKRTLETNEYVKKKEDIQKKRDEAIECLVKKFNDAVKEFEISKSEEESARYQVTPPNSFQVRVMEETKKFRQIGAKIAYGGKEKATRSRW